MTAPECRWNDEHEDLTADEEEHKWPLRKYQHLLPSSNRTVDSLKQDLFLGKLSISSLRSHKVLSKYSSFTANVNILFPAELSTKLRCTVARTADRAVNPTTGTTDQRHLFYAILVSISDTQETSDNTSIQPSRILVRGPAVPYFSPTLEDIKGAKQNGNLKVNFSSVAARHVNEESEVRDARLMAMRLLMDKLEKLVHEEMGSDEKIEIWESKSWKHNESGSDKDESMKSVKRGSTGGFGGFLQKI
jgi:hypothetical protein